jgi:hypothetical protein
VDQYGAQLGLDASLLQCTLRRMSRADERQAQVVLAHMAEVWLRLADRYQDVGKRQPTFSSNSRCSLRKIGRPAQYPPSGNKESPGRAGICRLVALLGPRVSRLEFAKWAKLDIEPASPNDRIEPHSDISGRFLLRCTGLACYT